MRQHDSTCAAEHLRMMVNRNCLLENKVTTATGPSVSRRRAQKVLSDVFFSFASEGGGREGGAGGALQDPPRPEQPPVGARDPERRVPRQEPADGAETGHHAGTQST